MRAVPYPRTIKWREMMTWWIKDLDRRLTKLEEAGQEDS